MGAVQRVVLLLMLAVLATGAAPAPEDCHNLTKALTDMQRVSVAQFSLRRTCNVFASDAPAGFW